MTNLTRTLYTTPTVHIYAIPPLTSTSGFKAAPWTAPPRPTAQQIFTARLRILETSTSTGTLTVTLHLEDPSTGDLFAAAPYTSPAVVQSALDSSRFFAVRVVGDGGMKATLGLGFEDRSDAFDFGIALGDARKVLGWERKESGGSGGAAAAWEGEQARDFRLKEGEKIHIQGEDGKALFSIAPPPAAAGKGLEGGFPGLAPPPPAQGVQGKTAQELGFDDGEFGEFQ
ncbi:hypothetical protein Q7P37_008540 [Cladosporium fusiforme]